MHGGENFIPLHGVEIEVVTGAIGGAGEPHGIDIVRALFIRLNNVTAIGQRLTQADTDSGLAGGFVCRGDQQAFHMKEAGRDVIDRALPSIVS